MAVTTLLKYTRHFLHAAFCLCAFLPLPCVHRFVQLLYRLVWICWLCINIVQMGELMADARWNMSFFVGCILFMLNSATNVLTICEAHWHQHRYERIREAQTEIDILLQLWLRVDAQVRQQRDAILVRNIWRLLLLQFACDVIKMIITIFATVTSIFWVYLPVELLLRMRYIQITVIIMELNERVKLLAHSMRQLAATNAAYKCAYTVSIWRPFSAWEYERLHALRYIYGRLYKAYALINDCFGWSLLTILITAFFDFVCNAFWCFQETISDPSWNVLVYNGCTTLTFGSLVWSMFGVSHASMSNLVGMLVAHNIRLTREFLRQLPIWQRNWRMSTAQFLIAFLEYSLRLFGLIPLLRYSAVSVCYTGLWLLEIGYMLYQAAEQHRIVKLELLSDVVHMLLFLTKISAHFIVLLDSLYFGADTEKMLSAETLRVHAVLQQLHHKPFQQAHITWMLIKQILLILTLLLSCHAAILWSLRAASAYYWFSLLSTVALQCKIIGIFIPLAYYNGYAATLQRNVNALGERNLRRLYDLSAIEKVPLKLVMVQPTPIGGTLGRALREDSQEQSSLEFELHQLRLLKRLHSELYRLFQLYNMRNGWSLLAFTTLCFAELVCNSYWIVLTLITNNSVYTYVQYFALLLIAALLLGMLCWLTQQSSNHSRDIGCMSYKLVKPLGNKRYNDLVSEFSLQVLHQRFIITAKEFFDFNLSLLGKMVAAIVTYLVILLQFMFTEKSAIEHTTNIQGNITKHH